VNTQDAVAGVGVVDNVGRSVSGGDDRCAVDRVRAGDPDERMGCSRGRPPDLKVGEPPASGPDIVAWRSAEKFSIAMTNEILVMASLLLVPGLIGLYLSLVGFDRRKATTGCGIVAVLIPVIVVLACVHGRFVYPVYGIDLNEPSVMQLVAAIYYGGQHAVVLLVGPATILLSLAMRNTPYGKPVVYLGLTTDIVTSSAPTRG